MFLGLAMKHMSGMVLSEIMTVTLIIAVGCAIAFGIYVSSVRDASVDKAEASLVEIMSVVKSAQESGMSISCNNSLVGAEVLANDFIPLTIKPMPFSLENTAQGFGVGVFVSSVREEDGNDTFIAAERLQVSLAESEKFTVRMSMQGEDEIAYAVLMSDEVACANSLASN